ncbi:ADP-ribosylation factor GTPase-activating protein AGD2-like isoform X5 [Juglans microcarpa x Juglans regia]|uniref:ADP-ribosylation factor GTPase-activating protein AGD2-like isoform X5 n=1 Tax=Juglans microcarpa x Juglans regia TaxID=2249226 RepID=UPI001B7EC6FB|nr:ADP-ribosylation factor GTPase-activating protein AGD2-like isoform X5 [Juglans microcarpa x Juglans regia]
MSSFIKLDDSPMFLKQIHALEQTTDELKDRCQRLYKGSKKFIAALGEAFNGDSAFADSLEAFGGGQDDPVSVSIGGPVMSKFINAFHELATHKELLRSQVEHVLIDRLTQFMTVDLEDAKESSRRFEKSIHAYDQAREKFVSLKKNTRGDVVAALEEDLQNSKSAFESSRFNLVNALMNIESKKKYEFLETISAMMDAHLRYFKLGYELLSPMEPFIHQVLTYAQQSKERANVEQDKLAKRIQEYRMQSELDNMRASSNLEHSSGINNIHVAGKSSYGNVEGIMQSTSGEVQAVKQGYLLKRSSSLRGDWKRRFFVLDSQGTFCYYRIKSTKPVAENEADRMDWINKITGAITSLLNSHFLQKLHPGRKLVKSSSGAFTDVQSLDSHESLKDDTKFSEADSVSSILRAIPGNDICAECSTPEPDWASLNLGVLLCIECSGVHRNLGVHISKVRSLTLDVRVWEPTVLDLFRNLGNSFCNSIWEELLLHENERIDESRTMMASVTKPCPKDVISCKEKYIQSKYVERLLVVREVGASGIPSHASKIWQAVKSNNLQEVYRLIVTSEKSIIKTTFDDVDGVDICHHVDVQDSETMQKRQYDPAVCERINHSNEAGNCLQGCSLLHLACNTGNPLMLELLLQFGADINMRDFHGRTPLHHCISSGNNQLARLLLRRGARSSIKDGGGLSVLERAMELGAITDEELFILLSESE